MSKNILLRMKRIIVFVLVFTITLTFSVDGFTEEKDISEMRMRDKFTFQSDKISTIGELNTGKFYYQVEDEYVAKGYSNYTGEDIIFDAQAIKGSSGDTIPLKAGIGGSSENSLEWNENYDWFEWEVSAPEDGLYEIEIGYHSIADIGVNAVRSLYIDGQIPFKEASNVTFLWSWKDKDKPKLNNIGDEVTPSQVEIKKWHKTRLTDIAGFYSMPYRFYLTKGSHRIKLEFVDQPVAISRITLKAPEIVPAYDDVKNSYQEKGYKKSTSTVTFQAEEDVLEKSDSTLSRVANDDPLTEPYDSGYKRLNAIGDWYWRTGEQAITWKFTVPEDGLYKIGMRCGQWWGDGLPGYRQISIDGKVPFKELLEYRFEYDRDWRTEVLGDENGEPYLFYLTAGEHAITMKVKLGGLSEVIQSFSEDTVMLSDLLLRITMITGSTPDPNYEYELEKQIPDLLDSLQTLIDSLDYKISMLTEISKKNTSIVNSLKQAKSQMESMKKRPDTIPKRLNDLNTTQSTLSTWYRSLQEQPLIIDYFMVGNPDEKWDNAVSNFFQRFYVTVNNFLRSFTKDYDRIGSSFTDENTGEKSKIIKVWIARGTEWAEVLKTMTDEDFSQKSNIYINLNALPAGQVNAGQMNALMLAIVSGMAPDVAIGVDSNSPVELAIRDATADLSKMEGYEEAASRFLPGMLRPFKYKDGVYALPETMNFKALFYRKDIVDALGIKLPETWDDVYNFVLPVLYQNKMQFYAPQDFSMFLYQHGGDYYTEDNMGSALDTPEAYMAFKEMVELFTNYGIPYTTNFFNRFRTGDMPMGIAGFGEYMQISTAAPELAGRWGIVPIPGHMKPDGTIDRSVGGVVGQSVVILNQSKNKEEAWEFVKWWLDTDTQVKYGREMEALIGMQAKWNTANKDAFTRLSWKKDDLDVIRQQWDWTREMPVVLGGYFTGRHLNNAWNRIIVDQLSISVRDSLEQAVEDINKEMRAKQEEYGFTAQPR